MNTYIPDLTADRPCLIACKFYCPTEHCNKTYCQGSCEPFDSTPSPGSSEHLEQRLYPVEPLHLFISHSCNADIPHTINSTEKYIQLETEAGDWAGSRILLKLKFWKDWKKEVTTFILC